MFFLQGFAEKLFSRLQTCNERFEVNVIRVDFTYPNSILGLLLNIFFPFCWVFDVQEKILADLVSFT